MPQKVFRPSLKSLAALLSPLLLAFAIGVAATVANWSAWPTAAISLAILGLLGIWFLSHEIVIDDEKLSYKTLLGGRRTIPLKQVDVVELETGIKTYCDRFRSPLRLRISTSNPSKFKPLLINVRVFEAEDISQVIDVLTGVKGYPDSRG
jgi:hypothetical protein